MKNIDIKVYEYIRKNSQNMLHDDLYYILLDWADQHQEIQKELANYYSAYRVCHIDSNGKSYDLTFKGSEYDNPHKEARTYYHNIIEDGAEVAELWYCLNPYEVGEYRKGKLITSFERK